MLSRRLLNPNFKMSFVKLVKVPTNISPSCLRPILKLTSTNCVATQMLTGITRAVMFLLLPLGWMTLVLLSGIMKKGAHGLESMEHIDITY